MMLKSRVRGAKVWLASVRTEAWVHNRRMCRHMPGGITGLGADRGGDGVLGLGADKGPEA